MLLAKPGNDGFAQLRRKPAQFFGLRGAYLAAASYSSPLRLDRQVSR